MTQAEQIKDWIIWYGQTYNKPPTHGEYLVKVDGICKHDKKKAKNFRANIVKHSLHSTSKRAKYFKMVVQDNEYKYIDVL
jgi:hypothetical protein